MARHFKPLRGGGAAIVFQPYEITLLRGYASQMLELVGSARPEAPERPDAADLIASAFSDGPSEPPADPALARLFPDAYTDAGPDGDARAASAEFRRYTEEDLRGRKREDAQALVRSLDALAPSERRAVLHLKPDECRQWLGALNDLRLVIASRLGVTDEESYDELRELPEEDPREPLVMVYEWLTMLQDSLVEALMR
ncbi:DUF2017 domain-containing protein [Glycomyces sp. NRRL B-16210]|uniref:DUF2017 domain-containing protein n=1 Tax=Glycomyces sp. NRRL B-16210 TaxID=1463821 RepID=UPI0004BE6781|nr:DUF2017 domain-containing protein [Glycomyces sp. NRRL B-16210]